MSSRVGFSFLLTMLVVSSNCVLIWRVLDPVEFLFFSSLCPWAPEVTERTELDLSVFTIAPSKKKVQQNLLFYPSNIGSLAHVQRKPAANAELLADFYFGLVSLLSSKCFHGFLIIWVLAVSLDSIHSLHSSPSSNLSDPSPLPWTYKVLFVSGPLPLLLSDSPPISPQVSYFLLSLRFQLKCHVIG